MVSVPVRGIDLTSTFRRDAAMMLQAERPLVRVLVTPAGGKRGDMVDPQWSVARPICHHAATITRDDARIVRLVRPSVATSLGVPLSLPHTLARRTA